MAEFLQECPVAVFQNPCKNFDENQETESRFCLKQLSVSVRFPAPDTKARAGRGQARENRIQRHKRNKSEPLRFESASIGGVGMFAFAHLLHYL